MTPRIASRLPAALFSLCLLALPCAAPADERAGILSSAPRE